MDWKRGSTAQSAKIVCVLFVLWSLHLSQSLFAQSASVISELSSSSITRDESVILTVTAIGVEGDLDASALERDFDVISQSSSRQISTVTDGSNRTVTTSIVIWTLEMLPRDVGVFTVPAVRVGNESSQLLSLTVNEIPVGARRDVFVEASVDTRTPWVQSQIVMTVRVFQGIEIVEGGLSDPVGSDIEVQRIGKDSYSSERRDGREFRVTERRFALFPQKSGTLQIEPVVLSVSVPATTTTARGFFSPTRKLSRRSDAITLDVQQRPQTGAAWWLPASAVQLDGSWADDVSQAVVDQPLTRTIVMRAGGVLDSQLPDITIPAIDGVSLYAEEPVRAMGMNDRGLVAEQTIKWALIPQREGELVLPAVAVEWFNTHTGRSETAVLPEERIQVGKPVGAAGKLPSTTVREAASAVASSGGDTTGTQAPVETLTSLDSGGREDELFAGQPEEQSESIASTPSSVTREGSVGSESAGIDASLAGSGSVSARVPGSPTAAASGVFERPWRLAAMVLSVLWVCTLMAFWWWRRQLSDRHASDQHEVKLPGSRQTRAGFHKVASLAQVESACRAQDPAAVRRALMQWAAQQWPEDTPCTLTDLVACVGKGAAADALLALDAGLYSRSTTGEGHDELMTRLRNLSADLSSALAARDDAAIASSGGSGHRSARSDTGLPVL